MLNWHHSRLDLYWIQSGVNLTPGFLQCKALELLKLSDEMWKTGKNITCILKDVDYLWKTMDTAVLSDNISKVVPNVTIQVANAAAICACVAELTI